MRLLTMVQQGMGTNLHCSKNPNGGYHWPQSATGHDLLARCGICGEVIARKARGERWGTPFIIQEVPA